MKQRTQRSYLNESDIEHGRAEGERERMILYSTKDISFLVLTGPE